MGIASQGNSVRIVSRIAVCCAIQRHSGLYFSTGPDISEGNFHGLLTDMNLEMRTRPSKTEPQDSKMGPRLGTSRRERQIVRILALLRVLGQGRRPTVHELAAEFRTRRETIYRDLRVLQDAGYPITGDERGRLSRPRLISSDVPDIRFSAAELEALLLAVAQAQTALPNSESNSSAALKLKALAQSAQDAAAPGLDEMFDTWTCGWKDYRAHEDRIALLIEAILRKRRCVVEYRKPSRAEPKTYDFDPYRLLFVGGGLYVVGRVPKHAGTVTLAIDRLLSVILSKTEFEVDQTFDPQKCRRDAFGVSWQDPAEVVLRFRADQAPYVRERLWHPSQQLTDLSDGGVQLTFRAGGQFEIRRWILGWGDAVEVISPNELRDEMRHILTSAISFYRA
jgi:predicted DNA-binding transcriptional regulator YafY